MPRSPERMALRHQTEASEERELGGVRARAGPTPLRRMTGGARARDLSRATMYDVDDDADFPSLVLYIMFPDSLISCFCSFLFSPCTLRIGLGCSRHRCGVQKEAVSPGVRWSLALCIPLELESLEHLTCIGFGGFVTLSRHDGARGPLLDADILALITRRTRNKDTGWRGFGY